jgi:hypothetical protein
MSRSIRNDSQPVEENAGDNTDYKNQKKRHDRVGAGQSGEKLRDKGPRC